ncbi:hypothetical protein CBM2606_A100001 [Cupriavidus taiwanensis]|nr:hypothetical protein CBM2606_A100001 [Cupriavidus taiwanensis]
MSLARRKRGGRREARVACRSLNAAFAAGSPGLAKFVAGSDGGDIDPGMDYLQALPVPVQEFVQVVAVQYATPPVRACIGSCRDGAEVLTSKKLLPDVTLATGRENEPSAAHQYRPRHLGRGNPDVPGKIRIPAIRQPGA